MPEAGLTRRRFLQWIAAASTAAAVCPPMGAGASFGALREYDDGNDTVPGGILGDPGTVIIVGAGFAGLTAANALANAGVDSIVLEGRDRLGGRAWTKQVGGFPIDLGCSWIHDPVGNPMTRFALQAGVLETPADVEVDIPTIRFFDGKTGPVTLPEAAPVYAHYLSFGEEIAALSEELGPNATLKDGIERYLDREGIEGDLRRRVEYLLRVVIEEPEATDWDVLSLEYLATYEGPDYFGIGQGNFPRGGYRRLVEAMGGSANVIFEHRVTSIRHDAFGVRVTAQPPVGSPIDFTGSHVIVTLPLGVLKAGSVGFDPGLPAAKQDAIERLWFGQLEKVVMTFEKPFWERGGHTHILHLSGVEAMEFPLFVDYHRLTGVPALVAFNSAAFARKLDQETPAAAERWALEVLGRVFGPGVAAPTDVAVTNWHDDPWSLGSYTSIPVGAAFDDLDALAEPVGGRVLFAGEATNRERFGYADGAMSTGIREAKRLLRQPSVELRAHRPPRRRLGETRRIETTDISAAKIAEERRAPARWLAGRRLPR